MSSASDENSVSPSPPTGQKRPGALQLGPRKKPSRTDPLVHYGRHFGRTIHALCTVSALLNNGLLSMEQVVKADEPLTHEEEQEHRVFKCLLQMVPGLEDRLTDGSEEEIEHIAQLIQKGASGARSDDTKSLKGVVLDWIVSQGQPLNPPLARNVKTGRGFLHERTGALLCPVSLDWSDSEIREGLRSGDITVSGDQWPIFIYRGYTYDFEDPWNGLFRSTLLVSAYKHVFTSPSSVEKEPKATRSGNARIHGMTQVTLPSIAYIATQVRFALSSSPVFSRTDTVTDSERFYNTVMDLFSDIDEKEEVDALQTWWNRQIFPSYLSTRLSICKHSALARIREKRLELRAMAVNVVLPDDHSTL